MSLPELDTILQLSIIYLGLMKNETAFAWFVSYLLDSDKGCQYSVDQISRSEMFNQVKQSLLVTDEAPIKLGKNMETSILSFTDEGNDIFSAAGPCQQQLDKEERLAGMKFVWNYFCLLEKVKTLTLTMEEIIYLEKNTQYKEDEIKEWFRFTVNSTCLHKNLNPTLDSEFSKLSVPIAKWRKKRWPSSTNW